MHFKRRRRRAGRVVLFVLAAVLLAALGTGMWLLWPRAMRRDMPSAAAPQGTLRGLRLSWSYPTSAGGLSSGGPEVLDTLTEREQKVLRLRFGLDDGRARTLEEVGKEFNVTRERIRQIEAKALRKLRHPSRSRKLKDYLD